MFPSKVFCFNFIRSTLRLEMGRMVDENDWLRDELGDTQRRLIDAEAELAELRYDLLMVPFITVSLNYLKSVLVYLQGGKEMFFTAMTATALNSFAFRCSQDCEWQPSSLMLKKVGAELSDCDVNASHVSCIIHAYCS